MKKKQAKKPINNNQDYTLSIFKDDDLKTKQLATDLRMDSKISVDNLFNRNNDLFNLPKKLHVPPDFTYSSVVDFKGY